MPTACVSHLVSTIIPVFNRAEMVIKAVNSVLAQTYRPIEIILVNDGSTDDTFTVLNNLSKLHSEISVVHQQNGGAGLARETGRRAAQGEYIQYLDSDDWLLSNKFEDQISALQKNLDCGIAYGTSMLVSESGAVISSSSRATGIQIDYLFPRLLNDRWWHTQTPLFRRSVVDAAGVWPRQRPEDWDIEARVGAARVKLVHCGSTVSCQLEHSGAERVSRQSKKLYLRDEAWFLPRLYECALKAGVAKQAPEMQLFSRWAFMRARDLGAIGEFSSAHQLLALAKKSAVRSKLSISVIEKMAQTLGWSATSKCCSTYLTLLNRAVT